MRTLRVMGIVGVSALLLSASVAFAEEGSVGATSVVAPTTREAAKKVELEKIRTAKEQMEKVRTETKKKVETAREEVKQRLEVVREEAKQKMETAREEMKTRVETVREEVKQRMETKREEAKQRLSDIKDKKKQQTVERIAAQFDKLNATWTDRFIEQLDRYDRIVLKIQSRADTAAGAGKDVTAVTTTIQSAQTAIATARTAVTAQVAKTYALDTSTLTTTTTLATDSGQSELVKAFRTSFQTMHSALFKDLFALRDGPMKDVRRAVENALKALQQVPRVDDDDDGDTATTTSATAN